MCEIKFHVRVPMDCWRQWIRHRTASVNEYSTRYSEAIDAVQTTKPDEWREQSSSNKQGSGAFLDTAVGGELSKEEAQRQTHAREVYRKRLKAKVAREQARKDLPLSTYTEAYWKIDLHNLLHFLSLRMDEHAQVEIRSYANVIGHEIVSRWCPLAWQAFLDYRIEAQTFSRLEMDILREPRPWPDRRGAATRGEFRLAQRRPRGTEAQSRARRPRAETARPRFGDSLGIETGTQLVRAGCHGHASVAMPPARR